MYPGLAHVGGGKDLLLLDCIDVYMITMLVEEHENRHLGNY
jgi:hypothetical protein